MTIPKTVRGTNIASHTSFVKSAAAFNTEIANSILFRKHITRTKLRAPKAHKIYASA